MEEEHLRRLWWLVPALALVVAGCGGGSDAADDVAEQYPNASEYQLELLADGVTWAEYEKAAIDMVTCMKDQGVEVSGPWPLGNWVTWDVAFPRGASEADIERVEEIGSDCEDEYFTVVSSVWNMSQLPTEEEVAEIERNRRACAWEYGFDTPDDMPHDEFYQVVTDHIDLLGPACVDKYPG